MLPIAPLMIEHRLIERMIAVLADEMKRIEKSKKVNPVFIDNAVDFIRIYADKTHHGKEEDILFRELKKKEMSEEHTKMLNELIQDHIFARKTTGSLVDAKNDYMNGDESAISTVIELLKTLSTFYPRHIEKEDKHFFIPVMKYFTKEEQEAMLEEGRIYDRKMIHRKYEQVVIEKEKERNIELPKENKNWLDFV